MVWSAAGPLKNDLVAKGVDYQRILWRDGAAFSFLDEGGVPRALTCDANTLVKYRLAIE
jgi:hypothetical protein